MTKVKEFYIRYAVNLRGFKEIKSWYLLVLLVVSSLSGCASDRLANLDELVSQRESKRDLVEVLKARPNLTKFSNALQKAGLVEVLGQNGRFTIFAPMDAAVVDHKLDEATVRHHILSQRVMSKDFVGESTGYTTLHSDVIEVNAADTIAVGDGLILEADIVAKNGVIHVIDRVLIPEALPTKLVSTAGATSQSADVMWPIVPKSLPPRPVWSRGDGTTSVIPAAPVIAQ